MYNAAIQMIGYAGVLGFILSYLQKTRKNIIFFTFLGRVFFVTHYILLGGYSGAVQNAIGGIASAISSQRGKKPFNSAASPVFIILLTVCGGILTFDAELGVISVLPVIAMIMQNSALWLKNQTHIRILTLIGIPFWLVYNFTKSSPPAMTSDVLSAISLISALLRYDIIPAIKRKGGKKLS